MSKKKYYAIKKDNGIVTKTWGQCKKITHGKSYQFAGFTTLEDAISFLNIPKEQIEFIGFKKDVESENIDVEISMISNSEVNIYTDGGCIPNPGGKGGIGVVILQNGKVVKKYKESFYPTTNNRMEVMAAIVGFSFLGENNTVKIVSDSKYLVNTMNGDYEMGKNIDLWRRLQNEIHRQKNVQFVWVKGHNDNPFNETCDELATEAIREENYTKDNGYEGKIKKIEQKQPEISDDMKNARVNIPVDILHPECARCIKDFLKIKKPSFKDFLTLKTYGQDYLSKLKFEDLDLYVPEEIMDCFMDNLQKNKQEVAKAARWFLRGLTVEQSIHKVKVDAEVRQNAINAR